ncbi:hypothetical protein DFH09DRAFT_936530, partial [Mycena vulgaris]
ASSNQLRATTLHHVKQRGGYVQIPHDREPANEFNKNSLLFPLAKRPVPVALKYTVAHLLNLADPRFQEHLSLLFTAFNILQRHEMLCTRLKGEM